MSGRAAKRCHAIVVTTDGRRYKMPWRATAQGAIGSAQRLIERKQLDGAKIDVMHRVNAGEGGMTLHDD